MPCVHPGVRYALLIGGGGPCQIFLISDLGDGRIGKGVVLQGVGNHVQIKTKLMEGGSTGAQVRPMCYSQNPDRPPAPPGYKLRMPECAFLLGTL